MVDNGMGPSLLTTWEYIYDFEYNYKTINSIILGKTFTLVIHSKVY